MRPALRFVSVQNMLILYTTVFHAWLLLSRTSSPPKHSASSRRSALRHGRMRQESVNSLHWAFVLSLHQQHGCCSQWTRAQPEFLERCRAQS